MYDLQEKDFINEFGSINLDIDDLPSKIEIPQSNKFMTNEIGIKYIGNMIKNIDMNLYVIYLEMAKNYIKFIDNYDVEKSFCLSDIVLGVTRDVNVIVPNIKNGIDILVTSHEIGHGLKMFTKVNNERHLHYRTMYDETISILFGRLCFERYINDFGYDVYAQQFELINITNAVFSLKSIKKLLSDYIKKKEIFNDINEKKDKNLEYNKGKYYSLVNEIEEIINKIYNTVSYPIGISLANIYDNFDKKQKEKYLEFISKYLLNIKHISFEMILDYFDIPFNANFYIENFKEYIDKYKTQNNKLVLGGK